MDSSTMITVLTVLGYGLTLLLGLLVGAFIWFLVIPKLLYWDFPGPKPHMLFGSFAPGSMKPGSSQLFVTDLVKKYGKVVQVWIFHRRMLILTDVDDVKHILITNPQPKTDSFNYSLAPITRDGLLTAPEDIHKIHRRALAAGMTDDFIQGLFTYMTKELGNFRRKLDVAAKEKTAVDMDKALTLYGLDIIFEAAFSRSYGIQDSSDHPLVKAVNDGLKSVFKNTSLYPFWKVLPVPQRLVEAVDVLEEFSNEIISNRNEEYKTGESTRQQDLLDLILKLPNQKETTAGGHALTFLVAGHDTTSHSMAFCLLELARHPEIEAKLIEELKSADGASGILSYKETQKLPYLHAVWKETLRLHPVAATGTTRVAKSPVTLPSGYSVPKGTEFLVPLYAVHRDPDYWTEPEKFIPERFLTQEKRNPFTFMPFSVGARNCIGQSFANYEATATLAHLLYHYKFKLAVEDKEIREFHSMVMRPRCIYQGISCGLPMHVEPRQL